MNGKGNPRGRLNFSCSFYPTMNVANPEEEEEKRKTEEAMGETFVDGSPSLDGKPSLEDSRKSIESVPKSVDTTYSKSGTGKGSELGLISADIGKELPNGDVAPAEKRIPKVHITPEDLSKYGQSRCILAFPNES